jgi:hypothetical protein
MQRAEELIVNGISVLLLSFLIWKLTGSVIDWLVMALPGAIIIVAGWIAALRN